MTPWVSSRHLHNSRLQYLHLVHPSYTPSVNQQYSSLESATHITTAHLSFKPSISTPRFTTTMSSTTGNISGKGGDAPSKGGAQQESTTAASTIRDHNVSLLIRSSSLLLPTFPHSCKPFLLLQPPVSLYTTPTQYPLYMKQKEFH